MEKSADASTNVDDYSHVEVGDEFEGEAAIEKHGTERDQNDMARMGKAQVLRVRLYHLDS